jgi:outer membrane protein OmpA-like peptidoglycan-associated protein
MEGGLVTVTAEAIASGLEKDGHISIYGIYFDTGKADIKPESKPALDEIVKVLKQHASMNVYVVGHTDNQGTLALNMKLSQDRASAVVQALTAAGIPAARLTAGGVGPLAPVGPNTTESGRAKNRRVELVQQ